ncbi:hypothetical protein LCGC14_1929530 [marine sediment metagenome]|uniref:Uncharacterized protein n=1 Tax=marine sediment metagenome TaxID=412755 RepID=A0A0F9I2A5_9ZZZZ
MWYQTLVGFMWLGFGGWASLNGDVLPAIIGLATASIIFTLSDTNTKKEK